MKYVNRIILVTILSFFCSSCSKSADRNEWNKIDGYWEGEFMTGNDLTLILSFVNQEKDVEGRVLLFQGKQQIQNDILSRIKLSENQLTFYIKAKDTPFSGKIDKDNMFIRGEFEFPDGSLHPLVVKRISKPSLGNFPSFDVEQSDKNVLTKTYSVSQLQEDFNFFRVKLENTHPQLYLYTSKESFNSIFDMTLKNLNSAMTENEFYRLISPLITKVRCVHTGIRHSDNYTNAIDSERHLIPLEVDVDNDAVIIVSNYSDNDLINKGSRIMSINDLPISDIISTIKYNIPSDGINETHKIRELNDNFPYYYSAYINSNEYFKVECISPVGKNISVVLNAQDLRTQNDAILSIYPERFIQRTLPYKIDLSNNSDTALLTINGFWSPDIEAYNSFLNESFSLFKKNDINNLIIDVRGNEGGHPFFAAELLTYLVNTSFTYFELPQEKDELEALFSPLQPKNEKFVGNVYVIMDGNCLSTTGHFLSLIKYHNIATLIGEESGGSFYCNDGSIQLALPNTGIKMNIPQAIFQTAVIGFERGDQLEPDYFVKSSYNDKLENRDRELEFVFQLIDSSR